MEPKGEDPIQKLKTQNKYFELSKTILLLKEITTLYQRVNHIQMKTHGMILRR